MRIETKSRVIASVLAICVAGAEWGFAQTLYSASDESKATEVRSSNEAGKRAPKPGPTPAANITTTTKTKSGSSKNDRSQPEAKQLQQKSDYDSTQNVVEYGGGG